MGEAGATFLEVLRVSDRLRLYSYWRSSAAYRVRIGLNLKGLPYDLEPVHLVRDGGQQHQPDYARLNPQHLVPTLMHGKRVLRQSLAILEYLDESWPERPLMPSSARDRARVRALAQLVACDIHPLGNLRVLRFFDEEWRVPPVEREAWVRHWVGEGLQAMETLLANDLVTGTYCHGEAPGLADCCLIPQLYNARRFEVDLSPYPTIARIEQACLALPAFIHASPERQPDAPGPAPLDA
ncbi:maleylacetoacetate isomerase [Pseudoxanthomonas sp. SORGH_AS 997]|uniref:Maleylacetoacetate isomerase n=1 Tax=Pseudoxanthomonas winnipegensis TaxID=2480810 RepID=A0AAW8GET0_9GAMM|nr:maleylacetoacetate isomerase [Pseudoxanthomonas winnipegensis]MDQ1133543.1 maleylacetoacetate isomerase [Pseudoxanthomonas winnipegensis]MDR6140215.1 maleylacetoacetate isomerase [Pseudoxanthomonas sp. SORGH_AS_0997]